MELPSKSRELDFRASRRPTKRSSEMNTAARSIWDMFSNSAAGRFIRAATPSDTKAWQKNCGPSKQTSRFFRLTGERPNGVSRAIYSDARRHSWQRISMQNWLYPAISKCSNSTAPHRTNSSTNAGGWDNRSKCCVVVNNGTVRRRRFRQLANFEIRRVRFVVDREERQHDDHTVPRFDFPPVCTVLFGSQQLAACDGPGRLGSRKENQWSVQQSDGVRMPRVQRLQTCPHRQVQFNTLAGSPFTAN